jgi:hypothetical protein
MTSLFFCHNRCSPKDLAARPFPQVEKVPAPDAATARGKPARLHIIQHAGYVNLTPLRRAVN